jgi:dTDP-4-dehydrorhamnose 3,5-epimerase
MKFRTASLADVIIVECEVFRDSRGFFLENYHSQKFREGGIATSFVQSNSAFSLFNTLRGLHMQNKFPQGKLVRCTSGEIFDVAVDARAESNSFGQWVGEILSAGNARQLWVPPGFLHGYCVLSPGGAQVEYKCTDFYHAEDEVGVIWNDPGIGISWPIREPVLSAKDLTWSHLMQVKKLLTIP